MSRLVKENPPYGLSAAAYLHSPRGKKIGLDPLQKCTLGKRDMTNRPHYYRNVLWYPLILRRVLFGIFTIILASTEEKNFTVKNKDKGLSLSKFS